MDTLMEGRPVKQSAKDLLDDLYLLLLINIANKTGSSNLLKKL